MPRPRALQPGAFGISPVWHTYLYCSPTLCNSWKPGQMAWPKPGGRSLQGGLASCLIFTLLQVAGSQGSDAGVRGRSTLEALWVTRTFLLSLLTWCLLVVTSNSPDGGGAMCSWSILVIRVVLLMYLSWSPYWSILGISSCQTLR